MLNITFRANAANPCLVCGTGSKGCSRTDDNLHLCRGEPRPGWHEISKRPDELGFRYYRREDEQRVAKLKPKKPTPPTTNFAAVANQGVEELARLPQHCEELADDLKLPLEVFELFRLGFDTTRSDSGRFTIPERDGNETVIGIATRTHRLSGKVEKKRVKGSKCGLTIPCQWRERPGPLFCVEGFTDAAAMTAAELCAVGRASNLHGADLLAVLLRDWPVEREIIVVGENDLKPNGDWPGKRGAETVARKLAHLLDRPVKVALPPENFKDVREWLTHPDVDFLSWSERGAKLSMLLIATAAPVDPPTGLPDDAAEGNPSSDQRPEIEVCTEEHHVNAQATTALVRETDIYQRGGMLVHVVEQNADSAPDDVVRRAAGAPVVRELVKPLLRERFTRMATWFQWRGKEDDLRKVSVHPPGWAVDAVHTRGYWPNVPYLEAVVTHPVLLGNGTLVSTNGYEKKSRLFVMMPPGLSVTVPELPTREDVTAAVDVLGDVIQDFPFETPQHRAAWFAALLTPLAWFAFNGPAPMFLIDANVRAAGKGLLADVAAIIITGRRFPVMSYTNDKEELRKKITTLAVEGERLVLLDNLAGAVGNDVLDMALTTDTWKDRLLGVNRGYCGPLNVTWFATGNNVQLGADTSRRVCHIRLESEKERPETRDDVTHQDLRGHVLQNRGKLLAAALTILRGWVVAGKPKHGLKPWGSFEQWSSVVREAVVFAGLPDPGDTRQQLQSMADRDANAMEGIIAGLADLDTHNRGMTAAEIVTRLKEDSSRSAPIADMRAAIEELCGKLCGRLLGYKFRHFARRNFGGKMLDKASSAHGKNRWVVVEASTKGSGHHAHHRNHPTPEPPANSCDGGDGGDGSAGRGITQELSVVAPKVQGRLFGNYEDQMLPD